MLGLHFVLGVMFAILAARVVIGNQGAALGEGLPR